MKTFLQFLFISLFIGLSNHSFGQCDIVSNWNFETRTSCPTALGQVNRAVGWFDANSLSVTYPSADYGNCGFNPITVPPAPPSGTGYVGFNAAWTGSSGGNGAEMIGTFANLCQGVTYTVSFYSMGVFGSGTQPIYKRCKYCFISSFFY
jgi:hypothetical protein